MSRIQVPSNSDLFLGIKLLEKSEGHTVWEVAFDRRCANPSGIIQGGFLCVLLDEAMGSAAVTYVKDRKVYCASAELKTSFLKIVNPDEKLVCEAKVIKGGKTVVFVEGEIRKEDETLVARASSTYILMPRV